MFSFESQARKGNERLVMEDELAERIMNRANSIE